jgi:hypothetical protein
MLLKSRESAIICIILDTLTIKYKHSIRFELLGVHSENFRGSLEQSSRGCHSATVAAVTPTGGCSITISGRGQYRDGITNLQILAALIIGPSSWWGGVQKKPGRWRATIDSGSEPEC